MCGIAGMYNTDGSQVNEAIINILTDAVSHRGPDGRGIWVNAQSNLALGHRRLSVLDTSINGKQPMSYDNGRYWITLNGEIYNFIEIRNELKEKGYSFCSETDTEVILAGYKHWGVEMLHRFNGMWAFALFDTLEEKLLLSRDRFGIKPLYYYINNQSLLFSSEVQAIHKIVGFEHPLNENVIKHIAQGGFLAHGTTQTYLKDVSSLPGGFNLIISKGEFELKEWYNIKKVSVPKSFKKQTEELRKLIQDACNLRMRSDVPVATCLSGGLDSGTITALIANYKPESDGRFNNYSHKGFCAAFPETQIDESKEAVRLGSQLNSHVNILDIKSPLQHELIEAMSQCDGPMHALAFYPIWKLYSHIRGNNISVTLDGQGPDEMLGGYRPLMEAMETAIGLGKPLWFWDVYNTYSAMGEFSQFSSKQFAKDELKKLLKIRLRKIKLLVKRLITNSDKSRTPEKISGEMLHYELNPVRIPDCKMNLLDKSLFKQFFQDPLPGILQQYDRCSMAHGVECRMPFMDFRIVEFIFSLPPTSKVGGGYTKKVLREAVKGILPDETRLNKTKIGFNAPIVDWFKGPLKEFMTCIMRSEEFLKSEYFDGKRLSEQFEIFLVSEKPQWNIAWQFWPPVHLTWWLMKKNMNRDVSSNSTFCL